MSGAATEGASPDPGMVDRREAVRAWAARTEALTHFGALVELMSLFAAALRRNDMRAAGERCAAMSRATTSINACLPTPRPEITEPLRRLVDDTEVFTGAFVDATATRDAELMHRALDAHRRITADLRELASAFESSIGLELPPAVAGAPAVARPRTTTAGGEQRSLRWSPSRGRARRALRTWVNSSQLVWWLDSFIADLESLMAGLATTDRAASTAAAGRLRAHAAAARSLSPAPDLAVSHSLALLADHLDDGMSRYLASDPGDPAENQHAAEALRRCEADSAGLMSGIERILGPGWLGPSVSGRRSR